jgi:hypothetical protein
MQRAVHFITITVLVVLMTTHDLSAQTSSEVWRNFAERVDIGTELNVRLEDGRRLRATLVGVRSDAALLQPKTRIPVPVQAVPYDTIVRLERTKRGVGAGKAVAIGVATGVGTFFATMAILLALVAD